MTTRVRRVVPVLGCAVAAAIGILPPSQAAASASAPQRSITVQLASGHANDIRALAHARHVAPGARRRLLDQLAPSADTHAKVERLLAAHGFTVTHETAFTVTATGRSPLDVRGLRGLATSVVDGATLAGRLRPAFTPTRLTGSVARQVYDTTEGTPPAGSTSPVIATLQFSGWNAADLSTYAAQAGLPDPVASRQYRAISVDGASPGVTDGNGGEEEVALDQETLLAVAPHAPQRVYIAPNSAKGEIDALEQVASDALTAHIGALSISWGLCEAYQGSTIGPIDNALYDVVAAGVTVFAASGDSGAFDCGGSTLGVGYPASDPLVVGVGGTSLDASTPSAAQEQVWWDAVGRDGGGGGVSGVFGQPDYQRNAASLAGRGVPDIALDGDPASGFGIYVDGADWQMGGTSLASPLAAATFVDLLASHGIPGGVGDIHDGLYAAPATAFRDVTVGTNGAYAAGPGYDEASGLGAPLWQELAPQLLGFVSVTAPAYSRSRVIPISATGAPGVSYSGWAAGVGTDPTTCPALSGSAPTAVTASADGTQNVWVVGVVGGRCSLADATTVVDTVAPTVNVTARLTHANASAVTFRWSAADAAPSSGIAHYAVTVTHNGSATPDYSTASTTGTAITLTGRPGATYTVKVTATDRAGNVSAGRAASVAVPVDDRSLRFSTHWSRSSATSAYLRTFDATKTRGAKASLTAYGRSFSVVVDTCGSCGHLTEYVDGRKVRTISLWSSRSRYARTFSVARFARDGRHSVTLVAAGGVVKIDGLSVTA